MRNIICFINKAFGLQINVKSDANRTYVSNTKQKRNMDTP